jgi:hypothetical protein
MKKIYNNIIPFKGFTAMTLWPFIFIRNDEAGKFSVQVERHEKIHGCQQKEMLIVPFLLWYGIEWLVKFCYYRNKMTAYKNVSFEREAYAHQSDASYTDNRKLFAWLKYIKQ